MCGILFTLRTKGDNDAGNSSAIRDEVAKRGPDVLHTVEFHPTIPGSSLGLSLGFTSSVLALRGDHVVRQPLQGYGQILCWNGQVFRGLNVGKEENDTEKIWEELCAGRSIVDVLGEVEGPYAFAHYNEPTTTLTFGRDRLGRRSLLINHQKDGTDSSRSGLGGLTIASVGCRSGQPPEEGEEKDEFEEVDCEGFWELKVDDIGQSSTGKLDFSKALRKVERPSTSAYSTIPRMRRTNPQQTPEIENAREVPPLGPGDEPNPSQDVVDDFITRLRESVRLRVENIPPAHSPSQSRLAVLFSGGIDCTFLAHLASLELPPGEPIDLLNVAFENPRSIAAAEEHNRQQLELGQRQRRKRNGMEPKEISLEPPGGVYDVPDRLTGRESLGMLRKLHPGREWRFVEVDIDYQESQAHRERILELMHPSDTEMDLSLAMPLYFAARRKGQLEGHGRYTSTAKVLLSGLGADELLGGYARHRREYQFRGWSGVIDEMQMDLDRIPTRNLGRDDRIIASHGVETRFPYLDMAFMRWVAELPIWTKCDLRAPEGKGDKSILRCAARQAGMGNVAEFKKRAMQFGTRAARMHPEEKGTKQRGLGAKKVGK